MYNLFFKSTGESSLPVKIFFVALASLLVMTLPDNSFAQSARTDHNSIYLELLGNGILYSINYDRMFSESICGRIGIMYIPTGEVDGEENVNVTIVPVTANYLVGKGKHKLELGLGALFVFADRDFDEQGGAVDEQGVAGTATFGYRFQPLNGGFVFRIGFTPIFTDNGFAPWGGLSFGYGF
ncbi:MAG: hypothetical protein ACE5IW_08680 [bacterium]